MHNATAPISNRPSVGDHPAAHPGAATRPPSDDAPPRIDAWTRLAEAERRLRLPQLTRDERRHLLGVKMHAATELRLRPLASHSEALLARLDDDHARTGDAPTQDDALAGAGESAIDVVRRRVALISPDSGFEATLDELADRIASWRVLTSAHGVHVVVDAREGRVVDPQPLGPLREAAARRVSPPDAPSRVWCDAPPGVVVEGLAPPFLFESALVAAVPSLDGHRPSVFVVEERGLAALAGLAMLEADADAADDRAVWFVGPGARDRFRRRLQSSLVSKLPGALVSTAGTPTLSEVIEAAHAEQRKAIDAAADRIVVRARSRGVRYWADRFDAALSGRAEPLRVLVVTSRFSTFVQHSARDLASALRRRGCDARLVAEPTDNDRLTSLAILEPFDRFDPDLVALFNHPASNIPAAGETGTPSVCWVQDRLVHLFDRQVGERQRPTDFVIGHMHGAMFDLHGWPRENAAFTSVPASADVFHDGPIDPELERRFACDVAYVGNQSTPPEAEHKRLRAELAHDDAARRALDRGFDAMKRRIHHGWRRFGVGRPSYVVHATLPMETLKEAGVGSPAPEYADKLQALYFAPIAELLFRHRTLEWAADVADRHGLRMHIYGRGWENHPTLGRFACGPVEHGEELRAVYACAAAHIHVSQNTNAHQRVAECALSGGLMLRSMPSPDARLIHLNLLRRLVRDAEPDHISPNGDRWYTLSESDDPSVPSGPRLRRLRMQPPAEYGPDTVTLRAPIEWIENDFFGVADLPLEQFPDWSFDDADESGFWERAELESALLRAARDRAWRDETVREQRGRAFVGMTYDAAVARMLDHVTTGLRRHAGAAP